MSKQNEIKQGDWITVNPASGEVMGVYSEGDHIVKDKIDDGFIHNFNKGESFVKIFDNTVVKMRKELSYAEMAFAISIIPYVSYNDNILRLNGKHLDIQDVCKELDTSYESGRKIIRGLIKKGVLIYTSVGCIADKNIKIKSIVANPFIYMRGTKEDREIAGMFEKTGWE